MLESDKAAVSTNHIYLFGGGPEGGAYPYPELSSLAYWPGGGPGGTS